MKIISRKDAILQGDLYYFTGKPCPKGHIEKRSVSQRVCAECNRCNAKKLTTVKLEEKREYFSNWQKENRDIANKNARKYYQLNKATVLARTIYYRELRRKRTPSWSEKEEIIEFYKKTPVGHEVDHIIPLQGANVSGFHVLANLQYLPIYENRAKGNKFE